MTTRLPELSDEDLKGLLERSAYEPLGRVPRTGTFGGRCAASCAWPRSPSPSPTWRAATATGRCAPPDRRIRARMSGTVVAASCARPKNPRRPRPLGPIDRTEARALLKALKGVEAADTTSLGRALAKLQHTAAGA